HASGRIDSHSINSRGNCLIGSAVYERGIFQPGTITRQHGKEPRVSGIRIAACFPRIGSNWKTRTSHASDDCASESIDSKSRLAVVTTPVAIPGSKVCTVQYRSCGWIEF